MTCPRHQRLGDACCDGECPLAWPPEDNPESARAWADERNEEGYIMFDEVITNDLAGLKEFEAHGKRWLRLLTISRNYGSF